MVMQENVALPLHDEAGWDTHCSGGPHLPCQPTVEWSVMSLRGMKTRHMPAGDPLWSAHCGLQQLLPRVRQQWASHNWTLCVPPLGGACLCVSRHSIKVLDAGTGEQLAFVQRDCTLAPDAGSQSSLLPSAAAGSQRPQPQRTPVGSHVGLPVGPGDVRHTITTRVRKTWLRWPSHTPDKRLESGCHVDDCEAMLHQPICATMVAGRLAVGTARSVTLLQFPAFDTLP